ncbi:C47 family peptidase, partial [Lactococcus hircilactis]
MTMGILLLLFSTIAPSVAAYTTSKDIVTKDDVSVEIKQIKELNNAFLNVYVDDSTDVLPQTLTTLLSKDSVGGYGNYTVMDSPRDVKRYVYPGATDAQLRGATITPEQAVAWLHHVGYTATLINRPLTTNEIKEKLDASIPIIPILSSSNTTDWLGGAYAGLLYAHDDVAVAKNPKLNKSFIEAINLGDGMIQDGQENQPFSFNNSKSDEQNTQNSGKYQWKQTITDIKKDPSMINAQTIDSNRVGGIFQSKKTISGQYSSVEFTDSSIIKATQSHDVPTISYGTYMQNKAWMPAVTSGWTGVPGGTLRMEAFKANVTHLPEGITGGISYSAHVQNIGWQAAVSDGAMAGTTGQSLRIEAIKINLTGKLAQQYDIYYSGYIEGTGYTDYVKNGEILGKTGTSKMLNGVNILLRKKTPSPSQEVKESAVKLINLYEDGNHQKTISDLESFAKISSSDAVSAQQIMDWYHFLGFEFDTNQGRFSKDKAMALNDTGRIYLTLLKASKESTGLKNYGLIGTGYMNNSAGYQPNMVTFSDQDVVPYARWVPTAKEKINVDLLFERQKNYSYDTFSTIDLYGNAVDDFQEEVTLYNIRAKKIDDKVVFPSTGTGTNPSVTDVKSNANFKTISSFSVREVQGQEPWCAEYDAAAIINSLNKISNESTNNVVTAKDLMASYLPGKTEEQLKKMGGQDIKSSLTVLKNKYQVAADVIDRKLTFGEVKQQIDNGQPIEMDVFDKDNDAPRGTENNSGHAILIVGYVIPKDGDISTHAPYYEIWNPWWGKTFYVSSSASIINLCGT